MTSTQGGVMAAPTDPGTCTVSTDGAGARQTSIPHNRGEGRSASGRRAERSDADTPDLQTLAVRASQGDMDAAGDIYRQFLVPIYRYVARKVGNPDAARDVTQDVFVKAIHGLRTVDWVEPHLGPWLFTIARNVVIDRHRSVSARPECVEEDPDLPAGDESDPFTVADRHLTSAVVRAAVMRLREEDRNIVALRYLCDVPIAETAAVLGLTEARVKCRSFYALRVLRNDLSAGVAA